MLLASLATVSSHINSFCAFRNGGESMLAAPSKMAIAFVKAGMPVRPSTVDGRRSYSACPRVEIWLQYLIFAFQNSYSLALFLAS